MTPAMLGLLAFAALVAIWLASILAIFLRRRHTARLRSLATALKNDYHGDVHSQRMIDDASRTYLERSAAFAFPVIIPVTILALAVIGLIRRLRRQTLFSPLEGVEWARFRDQEAKLAVEAAHGLGTVRADPRFRRLVELAVEVEMMRSPFLSLSTTVLSALPLLLYALAYGGREALMILPRITLHLAGAFRPLLRSPTEPQKSGVTEPTKR
ncbi:hypothetical protein [Microvirga puerhi]|uniref:Uncharacterized protein n=1 Tax=Microvirga puerhi TaxID=2876078 RepID=A0ABS7VRD4_9HYPH|nr:hypothetical protein [Microvirga puerhi]MBZ6078089.1 hypothetical protein [Microvirga puerhi]